MPQNKSRHLNEEQKLFLSKVVVKACHPRKLLKKSKYKLDYRYQRCQNCIVSDRDAVIYNDNAEIKGMQKEEMEQGFIDCHAPSTDTQEAQRKMYTCVCFIVDYSRTCSTQRGTWWYACCNSTKGFRYSTVTFTRPIRLTTLSKTKW